MYPYLETFRRALPTFPDVETAGKPPREKGRKYYFQGTVAVPGRVGKIVDLADDPSDFKPRVLFYDRDVFLDHIRGGVLLFLPRGG